MRRLLWIGDAACDSGFSRATHYILEEVRKTWDVTVLGINYRGDPHTYPYPIYPAWPGGDMFGLGRAPEMVRRVKPDVVVIQNDPWNIPAYVKAIEAIDVQDAPKPQLVGIIAIDGKNARGWALNGLDHVIFWTEFARYEAMRGGYKGTCGVVPLGVDLDVYKPGDPLVARRDILQLPDFTWGGFIVGNVNRNQPRKRMDLTIQWFAEWVQSREIQDAFLYLHVAPTGDYGYDCDQLAGYLNLFKRLILAEPEVFKGVDEHLLAATYQAFDVQITTTQGEGWGLTTMEGMACGVPQIVPRWSALAEWPGDAVVSVPCEPICGLHKVNVMGGLPEKDSFIKYLDQMYKNKTMREHYREMGLNLVREPRFRWDEIARGFAKEIETVADRAWS